MNQLDCLYVAVITYRRMNGEFVAFENNGQVFFFDWSIVCNLQLSCRDKNYN